MLLRDLPYWLSLAISSAPRNRARTRRYWNLRRKNTLRTSRCFRKSKSTATAPAIFTSYSNPRRPTMMANQTSPGISPSFWWTVRATWWHVSARRLPRKTLPGSYPSDNSTPTGSAAFSWGPGSAGLRLRFTQCRSNDCWSRVK